MVLLSHSGSTECSLFIVAIAGNYRAYVAIYLKEELKKLVKTR
jgi:hypothetical protein